MARVVGAGLLYFALTFGAGFLLGPIRILLIEPRVGVRAAELLEIPVMIGVTLLAARWVTAGSLCRLRRARGWAWACSPPGCCWWRNSLSY